MVFCELFAEVKGLGGKKKKKKEFQYCEYCVVISLLHTLVPRGWEVVSEALCYSEQRSPQVRVVSFVCLP